VIIFPAIDLKDGQCVRLKRGLMEEATIFNADPAAQAKSFAGQGFRWLHCVDLNGAFAGKSINAEAIRAIRAAISLPIQLGGGIRDRAGVETWLDAGITRVILGTAALTNPTFVKEVARAYPGRIVVGADAKNGKVATQGWAEVSDLTPVELGKRFEDAGVAALLFTDIDGDGLLKGVNVKATAHLAKAGWVRWPTSKLWLPHANPISKVWWWAAPSMTGRSIPRRPWLLRPSFCSDGG